MDYRSTIEDMTPEIYERLKRAVETGKWPDGKPLTGEQRENALQAVIAYGELHLNSSERVGFIDRGHKDGDVCDDPASAAADGAVPLNFREEEKRGG